MVLMGGEYVNNPKSTLKGGMVAFWELNEAAATTRVDTINALDATDNNSVAQVAGQSGNAAGFDNYVTLNSQFLSVADNALLDISGVSPKSIGGWLYFDTLPSVAGFGCGFMIKQSNYQLYISTNNKVSFRLYYAAGASHITLTHQTTLSVATWHYIGLMYDGANLWVGVNDVWQSLAFGQSASDNANEVWFSKLNASSMLDGRMQKFGMWNRSLTWKEWKYLKSNGPYSP